MFSTYRLCCVHSPNRAISRKSSFTSLKYCTNLVQKLDNENYLCTLLLPQNIITTALAIRAFNVEIASVQDQVSQAQLGRMRLKFWEDCIEKMYKGKVPNNPVAVEMSKALRRHKLSKSHLQTLVSCRVKRLDQSSFFNMREMQTHAEESCAPIYLLLLQAAGIKSSTCDHVAIHCGTAQGLANLLRGIPHCSESRFVALPSDRLAHYEVSEESVLRGTAQINILDVVQEVASTALTHVELARDMIDDVPLEARALFLPTIPSYKYLCNLRDASFDVFDGGIQRKNPLLPFTLYWNRLIKNY